MMVRDNWDWNLTKIETGLYELGEEPGVKDLVLMQMNRS
jgi:hypothetical protein